MAERLLGLVVAVPFLLGAAAGPVAGDGEVVFELADPEIVESSGLVVRDGLFVTVNDSGDSGRIFTVDGSGRTVGTTSWVDDPRDVEALAPAGDGHVWVADIGDNRRARDQVEVLRVPFGTGEREVEPERYVLVHPDGAQDAEGLLAHPVTGQLVVVTKGLFGGSVQVAPERLSADRPNPLRVVGDTLGMATDAAFFPDGRHLVVRGYGDAEVLAWPSLERVGELALPEQQQGEGIAVDERGEVYVSTEGLHAPVHRVPLPAELSAALAPPSASAPPATPDASPAAADRQESADRQEAATDRPLWHWLAGLGAGLLLIVVLLRSLRPR